MSNLVKLLGSYDVIVQYTSLKAVANMLTTESEIVIDRAIFENVLEKLLTLAKEQPRDSNFITEICFCLSNIVSGTDEHVKHFMSHPEALDYTLTEFILKSVDLG